VHFNFFTGTLQVISTAAYLIYELQICNRVHDNATDYGTREYEYQIEGTYDALGFSLVQEFPPPQKQLSKMKEDGHKNQEEV